MEPFRFFYFHWHFPDIFLQSSSLTISLLYLWMEWAMILSYHWEGALWPLKSLDCPTFCLSLREDALLKPEYLNKYEIHWSMVLQAGSYGRRIPSQCAVRLSHVACLDQWFTSRKDVSHLWQKLQEPMWGSFFLLSWWLATCILAAPIAWDSKGWWWQQCSPKSPSRTVTKVRN